MIAGAGVGGAGCALALERAGFEVTLYEAHPGPGNTPGPESPEAGRGDGGPEGAGQGAGSAGGGPEGAGPGAERADGGRGGAGQGAGRADGRSGGAVAGRVFGGGAGELGAFLTLASNGMRALAAAGAAEAVAGAGFELTEMRVLGESGEELGLVPLSGHADPLTRFRALRRADLCAVLRAEAVRRGIPVHYGARLAAVEEDSDGVTARFADGRTARGALLVGADGLNSVTRTLLDPGVAGPRYAGQRVFYGYTTDVRPPPEPLPRITMIRGSGAAFGYAVSPAGEAYWFARVPGDALPAAEIAATPVDRWRADLVEVLGADATPAAGIVAATTDLMVTNARDLPEVPRWRTPRTLIIGDAAHAASPATGQGASMALEDAVVLAKALRDGESQEAALATYERLRRPRVAHNIANSARITGAMPSRADRDRHNAKERQDRPKPSFTGEDLAIIHLLDWPAPLPT